MTAVFFLFLVPSWKWVSAILSLLHLSSLYQLFLSIFQWDLLGFPPPKGIMVVNNLYLTPFSWGALGGMDSLISMTFVWDMAFWVYLRSWQLSNQQLAWMSKVVQYLGILMKTSGKSTFWGDGIFCSGISANIPIIVGKYLPNGGFSMAMLPKELKLDVFPVLRTSLSCCVGWRYI